MILFKFGLVLLWIYYGFTMYLLYIHCGRADEVQQQNGYVGSTEKATNQARRTVLVVAKLIARQGMHYRDA